MLSPFLSDPPQNYRGLLITGKHKAEPDLRVDIILLRNVFGPPAPGLLLFKADIPREAYIGAEIRMVEWDLIWLYQDWAFVLLLALPSHQLRLLLDALTATTPAPTPTTTRMFSGGKRGATSLTA